MRCDPIKELRYIRLGVQVVCRLVMVVLYVLGYEHGSRPWQTRKPVSLSLEQKHARGPCRVTEE